MSEIALMQVLLDAVKSSNVGSSALSSCAIGEVVFLKDVRKDELMGHRVIMAVDGSSKELSCGLNAYPAIRYATPADVVASKVDDLVWSSELAENSVEFLKVHLDSLKEGSDFREIRLKCINKVMAHDFDYEESIAEASALGKKVTAEGGFPVFTPRCYNGYKEFRESLDKDTDYFIARTALLESQLKSKFLNLFETGGSEACNKKRLLQLTPVFELQD